MKKTYGVRVGLLAIGAMLLVPGFSWAQSRSAAGESAGGSDPAVAATESTASPSSASAASSASDLRHRIEALKAELAELNSELATASNDSSAASSDAAPQSQASSTPSNPPQGAAPAPAPSAPAPTSLPTPSMSGPLSTAVPHEISAGPFGKVEVTGILSGMGWTEGDYVPGDKPTHWDVSNAQVFVQKTTGWWQFYLQGGAYNIPALGTVFTSTQDTMKEFYGPFPQGYLKLVKGNFNVEIGALPTLIGAEYTFDFENMNIERGLLWNQENAVNRGIQINDTYKKLTLAFSWNDGFYSNHYNWLTGSAAWAFNSSNTLSFVGGGHFSGNGRNTFVTPELLNNSVMYNLIYTYTHGSWIISPYYQYTGVAKNTSIGINAGNHTNGGALLLDYAFKHGFSLAVRPEYIKSSGNVLDPNAVTDNLLYGPGTGAFSFTVTPTYIKDGFFLRGDFSIVHVTDYNSATSFAFGFKGTSLNQPRGVIEVGFMF
jgi:hypothetical protein